MSSTILEAKAIISGEDRVSPILDKIAERVAKLDRQFATMGKVARETVGLAGTRSSGLGDVFGRLERTQARLGRSIDTMAKSVDALARTPLARGRDAEGGHGRGGGAHLAGHALGFAAGFGAVEAAEATGKASADRVHEQARMRLSGMTDAEISRANVEAARLAAEMPAVGATDALHEMRNARAVIGSSAEAAPLMASLLKLRVIAQAQRPGEDVTEDMDKLIKGLEIKGATRDPREFERYLNGVAKGLSVFGDTLRPTDYFQMMLYGRQATPRLSEDFILSTAPTLAQELRGSSYGRAVSAFNRAIVGGRMSSDSLHELQRIGLVGADDINEKKGELKPGKSVAGWQSAQSDPNEWVRKFLLPAMEKNGITDPSTVSKVIGELFSNQLAAQMVSILATQQSKIDKDQALVHGAMGLDGANYALRNDPEIAAHALKESLTGMAATLGEGIARSLAPVMADLASAIAKYTARVAENNEFLKNHPGASDTPITKETRHAFNQAAFGIDSDKAYAAIPDELKLEAGYRKRRALLLKWRDEEITDPKKLAEIAERRKHVAPGFERSAKAQDDAEQFPMRAAAEKQLAELDRAYAEFRRRRVFGPFLPERFGPFQPGQGPDGPLHPAAPSVGAPGTPPALPSLKELLEGKIEATVKPDQVTAKLEGHVQGHVTISVDAAPGLLAAVKSTSGSSIEHFGLDVGTSMPNTRVGASINSGR